MAAPVVDVNLTTLTDSDQNTGYEDIGSGSGSGVETDYYVQRTGTNANRSISRTISNRRRGMYYDINLGGLSAAPFQTSITPAQFSAGNHVYIWMYVTGYPATDSLANGGVTIALTNGTDNVYKEYYVDGNENLVGGWKCYVANGSNTADAEIGTGAANLGVGANVIGVGGVIETIQAVGKANFAIDAIRVGTGLAISRGEDPDNQPTLGPAVFTSVTDVNDNIQNAYGVFRSSGAGAEIQGELTIGIDDTTTDTFFKDTNYVIFNPNKNPRFPTTSATLSDFTGVSVQGGLTTCILDNVSFVSNDLHDKGYFYANNGTNDPLNVDLDGCTFQGWGETRMTSNTSITNTTWINCEPVTLNGGTLDQCTVQAGVGGSYIIAAGTPNNVSNTSFIGAGDAGGHGIEVTSGGTYTFEGNLVSGFGAEGTDGAFINIPTAGIAVTFSITNSGTASTTGGGLSAKLASGSTFDVEAAVTVNINGLPVVPTGNGTEIRVLEAGANTEIAGVGTENHRTSTYSFPLSLGTNFDLRIVNLSYNVFFLADQTANTDPTNIPVDLKIDRVYNDDTPPSGEAE